MGRHVPQAKKPRFAKRQIGVFACTQNYTKRISNRFPSPCAVLASAAIEGIVCPFSMAADIRLTKPCALRQLRWRQVFFIPCAKNHHHPLIARFILIPFLFEMQREIIIERRGILEYTLSLVPQKGVSIEPAASIYSSFP